MSIADTVGTAGAADGTESWKSGVRDETRSIARTGLLIVGGFLLIFGGWALLFPLASAVVAGGVVISAGQNKLIQHPVGGSILEILARDGDKVAQGDPIVILDPVVDEAQYDQLRSRQATLKATEARIEARLSGADTVAFPPEFQAASISQASTGSATSPTREMALRDHYRRIMADEVETFRSGRKRLEEEVAAYREQVESLRKQAVGIDAQKASADSQLDILRDQADRMRPLVRDGYVARRELNDIDRQINDLEGNATNLAAEALSTRHKISEVENRIQQTIQQNREELGMELAKVRGEISELDNQLRAAGDSVEKREVRAPVSGVVAKSSVHTIGGVVRAGDIIAEIVPGDSVPMIEAKVKPSDIDYVQAGQRAEVVITAFNRRLYDPVNAEVELVEADAELNERTQEKFFTVRLKITDTPSQFNRVNDLRPGMEAEVFIQTERRTFLTYLLKPISDSFRRAFQER